MSKAIDEIEDYKDALDRGHYTLKEKLVIRFDGKPYMYDVNIDEFRLVTQEDVDRWLDFMQTFGPALSDIKSAWTKWEAKK